MHAMQDRPNCCYSLRQQLSVETEVNTARSWPHDYATLQTGCRRCY